jgi:hypothetical protein
MQKHGILEEEKAKLSLYVLFHGVRFFCKDRLLDFTSSLQFFKSLKHCSFFDFPLNRVSSGYKATLNTNTL